MMTMVNVTLLFVLAAWIVGRDDGRAARRHARRPGTRDRRWARHRSPPSTTRRPAGAHALLSGARAAAAGRRVRRGGVAQDDPRPHVAQRALRDRVLPAPAEPGRPDRVVEPGAPIDS
jgi:hypothetical protein